MAQETESCPSCTCPVRVVPHSTGSSIRYSAKCSNDGCGLETNKFATQELALAAIRPTWSVLDGEDGDLRILLEERLVAGICEGCGKPVVVGHVVHRYNDVGEVHVDCERPYDLPVLPSKGTEEDPHVFVMLGNPLMCYHAPLRIR